MIWIILLNRLVKLSRVVVSMVECMLVIVISVRFMLVLKYRIIVFRWLCICCVI